MEIPCSTCQGSGFKLNQFTGNESTCTECYEGIITVCIAFTSDRPAAFRNRTCNTCNATEIQHSFVAEYLSIKS